MAEANIKTTVSIEAVLHRTFQKFVQEIADEYGVQVIDVSFDWAERIGAPAQIQECRVQTKSNIGWSNVGKTSVQKDKSTCPKCHGPLDPPDLLDDGLYCPVCGYLPPR